MQQINLYLPEFQPNREPMRAVHMLIGLGVVIVLLIALSVMSHFQLKKLQQKVKLEQQAQDVLQQQLNLLTAKKPVNGGTDLDIKIDALQKDLQRRNQILGMISNKNLGNNHGFSAQLKSLAKAALPTVSIETFSLQSGGSYAEMSGKATSADQIPLYLKKLHSDPSFAQVAVGVLNVQRVENNSNLLSFRLAKAEDEKTIMSVLTGKR